jgi:two-component system KDP operon response regulator KdpE
MPDALLLVVEDEPAMATVITAGLAARGYWVKSVGTGRETIEAVVDASPAVVILDLGLPDADGIDVCRALRTWSQVPIIVLTADGDEDRKIDALDAGADDYITKPFSMRELLARVRVAVRHTGSRTPNAAVLTVGDLAIDIARHQVTLGGRQVSLTPKEFEMLALLARHAGSVLTNRTILAEIWGPRGEGHSEYLRVYARALRQKLGDDPKNPRLVTEPGVGYRIVAESDAIPLEPPSDAALQT